MSGDAAASQNGNESDSRVNTVNTPYLIKKKQNLIGTAVSQNGMESENYVNIVNTSYLLEN